MIYVTFDELRSKLELDNLTQGIIKEAFHALVGDQKNHFLFTNLKEYKEKTVEYALKRGWDPETTVVLYDPPKEEQTTDDAAKPIDATASGDIDWDDIQIGISPQQIICSFFTNMTVEKMVHVINSYGRMKAFL